MEEETKRFSDQAGPLLAGLMDYWIVKIDGANTISYSSNYVKFTFINLN